MIGCLRTRVRKQPIIALYFESENELKFYNLEARAWFSAQIIHTQKYSTDSKVMGMEDSYCVRYIHTIGHIITKKCQNANLLPTISGYKGCEILFCTI